jgi:hypothetical protein
MVRARVLVAVLPLIGLLAGCDIFFGDTGTTPWYH